MQTIKLNLIPGSVLPVVNVSQYDAHRQFQLVVYEGATAYNLTGKTVEIRGTKPDGNGFAYDAQDGVVSVSNNVVTISTTQQMTAVGGQTMCELRITESGVILGTLNFVLMVEPSALSDDTPISDTDIPAIERDFEAALAEAEADALKAEGYAVGTQDGVPAQSGEPYYQDNAKYYKEQAEAAASGGGADALKAEGYAVGTQNGVPVTSGSPYYHNNAAYYEGEASTSATNAGNSETAAGNSATSAAADALEAEGWAVGEQGGTPVGPTSPYYENNAKYYCQQSPHTALTSLTDVNISSPSNDQVLKYDNATQKWVNGTGGGGASDLDDLTDVTLTSPTSGQFLKYDGAKWVNGNGGGGASALDDLTDVDITTPTDGQVLTYDAASQKWVNANGGGGGGGFDYKAWLQAASINPAGYADLAAVLADEKAVRKLMTIHLAVDYLAGQTAIDASINTILTDNTCAKWINLRDYALDTLYDNALFATVMDASGKYFLGEWAKLSTSPETWGPKGNVPIMTSNSAPYGTASAYQVFDGNNATTASGIDFNYKFVNPVCVKDFVVKDGSGNAITGGTLQASNDGSTWVTPVADTFYMAWNVHFGSSTTVGTVQFYGRDMKVSVPVMTSNTAPYGEVSASSENSASTVAWKAFDADGISTAWSGTTTTNQWIQYKFNHSTVVKMIGFIPDNDGSGTTPYNRIKDFTIKGSDNGNTWSDVFSDTAQATSGASWQYFDDDNTTPYDYYRMDIANCYSTARIGIKCLQFYGFDYSEYDWDADNPRHYLYDHGVELETMNARVVGTYDSVVTDKESSCIHCKLVNPTSAGGIATNTNSAIDLTSYNLVRATTGDRFIVNDTYQVVLAVASSNSANLQWANYDAYKGVINDIPNNAYLDVSNINESKCVYMSVAAGTASTRTFEFTLTELWLE